MIDLAILTQCTGVMDIESLLTYITLACNTSPRNNEGLNSYNTTTKQKQ